jgi:hypothetical protein
MTTTGTATKKTTVTHADGTVSKRSSKTRVYTHAVEISPAPAEKLAANLLRKAQEATARAAQLRKAADEGQVRIAPRGFRISNDYISYQATLAGTDRYIYTYCSADGRTEDVLNGREIVPVVGYLVDSARHAVGQHEETAAKLTAQAAEVLADGKPVGEYRIVRWSSSAVLAGKALSEFDAYVAAGCTVRVVPVDAK